jgi:hypothetical protein
MAGNAVEQLNGLTAVPATDYKKDATPPSLIGWRIFHNTFTIRLAFDETVDASSLEHKKLWLYGVGAESVFQLTDDSAPSVQNDGTVLTVVIGKNDMNEIKKQELLAVSNATSLLTFQANLVKDMVGLPVRTLYYSHIPVTLYEADESSPNLVSFKLDMNHAEPVLTLSFDETVRSSSIVSTGLTLRSMLDGVGSGDGPDGNAYTLQSVTPQELNGDVIVCTISIDDSNAIKQIRDLATMRETTFLDIAEGTFDDMVDIGVNPSSHKATAFTRDWTPPVLLEFTLDMTTHKLVLTFDETVDPATLIYSRFAFVNGAKAVKLTNGETNSVAGTEVTITLDIDDVDALKLEPGVATKDSDTFLRLWQGAIKDADGNSIAAITEHAVKSGGYQRDGTPPALVAVAVNINEANKRHPDLEF